MKFLVVVVRHRGQVIWLGHGEIIGTIAGDDTIFLAPAPRIPPANLVKRLISVWKKGMQ